MTMRTSLRNASIALLSATYLATTQAAEWKIDPSLRFKAGYVDNLRLSTANEISSAEATFSPSAAFSIATPISSTSATVRFDFRRFENDRDLDDNNSRFNIDSFRNMERSRLGLNLGFIKDTTLDTQLEETGIALDRVRKQSAIVRPSWTYTFNERTSVNANYSFRDVKYKTSGDSRFVGYTSNSAQASITRAMHKQATASITLLGSQTNTDNDVKSTNINLQGSSSYQFSETLLTSLSVGIRRTKTEFSRDTEFPLLFGNIEFDSTILSQDVSNISQGSTFSANITKNLLRGEISLSASRNISNASNGLPVEFTRLQMDSRYKISGILSANLNFVLSNSETQNDVSRTLNRDYYQIEPTFSWAVKKFWSLSGSYRYRRQTFGDASDDATQNAAYLTLTYHWPRIAVSR